MNKVLNIRHFNNSTAELDKQLGKGNWVYIGRELRRYSLKKSPLANPFKVKDYGGKVGTTIELFKAHLWELIKKGDVQVIRSLYNIGKNNTDVVCWCKDKHGEGACHGDVVVRAAQWVVSNTKVNNGGLVLRLKKS